MMDVLLLSIYELGHQSFAIASAAAWLRRAGLTVACIDASRDPIDDAALQSASLVAVSLPMHAATRLAIPLIRRIRATAPDCRLCCFGLYAPLNEDLLRAEGVDAILGPEFEQELVTLASASGPAPAIPAGTRPAAGGTSIPRLAFIQPDRTALPPLRRYAALRVGDESRVAGYTEASRGCKHRCRHCPIVPVYRGAFRLVPPEVVLADVRAQVQQGAAHVTFGDPDFFNAVGHAMVVVHALARECPGLTYDVTAKVEHLVRHADRLPELAATGCLFVTSAVESLDDRVLALLDKGHTRADFERAVRSCREASLTLSPTFVAFTPWTTVPGYLDLLDTIDRFDLREHVAPIQLALRLLVPNGSLLLDLDEVRDLVGPFDAASLVHPWKHPDIRVDALQDEVMRVVGARPGAPREEVFEEVRRTARRYAGETLAAGLAPADAPGAIGSAPAPLPARATVPYLEEPWYC
jgi:radical SAM superfamily enzyme YgiQ (UPF0313 family)